MSSSLQPPDTPASVKLLQIFAGAREAFLRQGFDGASMNDVARAAGVSKGTLYVYFDSKERLFEALIRHDRRLQAEQLCQFDPQDHNVATVLERFACDLVETMLQPSQVAHVRMVIGAVAKFPQIGRAFHEAGPAFAAARLSSYLSAQVAGGLLEIEDCKLAAQQFLDLCISGLFKQVLFAVSDTPSPPAIRANVEAAVALFLKAHAALPETVR